MCNNRIDWPCAGPNVAVGWVSVIASSRWRGQESWSALWCKPAVPLVTPWVPLYAWLDRLRFCVSVDMGCFLVYMCRRGLVSVSMELSELRLPTDHWIKINQILIRTSEGADSIAAVLCIPMTADNSSLAASFTLGKWQFIQVAELLHNLTFQPICGAWEKETYRAV